MALFLSTTPIPPLLRRRPLLSKPSPPIHASKPLLSTFSTTLAATTTAALLLSTTRPVALACPPPPPLSTSLDDPDDLRTQLDSLIKSDDFPAAVAVLDRLIPLSPSNEALDLNLLRCHLLSHAGDLSAAKSGFEDIISENPFQIEAFHGLVMVAGKFEDADVGVEEMREIVSRIEERIGVCEREKRKEELREFRLLIAQIRVMEGKFDEALKVYEQLVKEEPRDFRPYLCKGIVYSVLHKAGEAEKQFEKYRRLVPKGHPYAKYFDENVIAMKVFGQIEENKREKAAMKT